MKLFTVVSMIFFFGGLNAQVMTLSGTPEQVKDMAIKQFGLTSGGNQVAPLSQKDRELLGCAKSMMAVMKYKNQKGLITIEDVKLWLSDPDPSVGNDGVQLVRSNNGLRRTTSHTMYYVVDQNGNAKNKW